MRELELYGQVAGKDVVEHLRQLASLLKGLKVVHINSTRRGGGVAEILERMLEKDPPIYAYAPQEGFGYPPGKGFILNPHTMREGEEAIVADRLREILLKGREYAAQGKVG